MNEKTIDAALLKKMLIAGAQSLDAKRDWINDLNVFPVPDGDTGTNMCMTILSAVHEMEKLQQPTMAELSKAISSGSLRGARGNSGVILSQLLRGFAKTIEGQEEIDKVIIGEAFQKAVDTAYKAVMKPKEGTILTVARAAADKAVQLSADESCSMEDFVNAIVEEAEVVLEKTPDLLPVLKEAGVVDSGGQGLVEIFHGARDAYGGKEIEHTFSDIPIVEERVVPKTGISTENIEFGYCTEFIINIDGSLSDEEEDDYRAFLNSMGDSIVLVAEEDLVKTHVHTNDPGLVLQKALSYGPLSRIKIDNMREEHQEKVIQDADRLAREQAAEHAGEAQAVEYAGETQAPEHADETQAKEPAAADDAEPKKDIGFIAVSVGDGMNEVFTGLGADYLIEGGQTMNPSTDDMLKAIDQVNAETIFIFPNNKNIILAANQAAELSKDKQIVVIPTTTAPQGVTALINYVVGAGVEQNEALMNEAIGTVKTGQVTYAVRDTVFKEKEIHEGDYMGIGDSAILAAGDDLNAVVKDMVKGLVDEASSFICIYYGEDIAGEDAKAMGELIEEEYPDCEVEVQRGGQPIYYYIISVE